MNPARKILENASADAVFLTSDDVSFFYATQLDGVFEGCFAVVSDKLKIIVPQLEAETAQAHIKENKVKAELFVYASRAEIEKYIRESTKKRVLGLNFSKISIKTFESIKKFTNAKLVDVGEDINRARGTKEKDEIEKIKKACEIANKALEKTLPFVQQGVTESDLAARLDYEIRKQGATNSFATICAFGENSSQPHYVTGMRKLKKGDFVLLDFGARWKNYCSDITRTFVLGKASNEQKKIIECVKEAHEIGAKNLLEKEIANKSHCDVKDFIDKKYPGKFIHSLGHSIGVEVHDGLTLSQKSNFLLENNMVFTIEPGIYLPKKGGVRIEDDFVVSGKKPVCISRGQKIFE